MEFGQQEQDKLEQYSNTREEDEEEEDQLEQEQELDEELDDRSNNYNSTSSTKAHHHQHFLSFCGGPSTSSSSSAAAAKKWPQITTAATAPPRDQGAVLMDYLSLSNPNYAGSAAAAAAADHAGSDSNWVAGAGEREHMFDKVVTPSDVGKLNRLVIPKQHAEKYFPLDSSSTEKGLLLNFEDRNGKSWRFRYSYWNSSQSYVMTKGWSRFVKEKKLDAGDIVSFQRGLGDPGRSRLFIDWRRRPHHFPHHAAAASHLFHHHHHHSLMINNNNINNNAPSFPIDHHHHLQHRWGGGPYSLPSPMPIPIRHENFHYPGNSFNAIQYPNYGSHHYRHRPQQQQQQQYLSHDYTSANFGHQAGVASVSHHVSPILIEAAPVASAAPKRLRLFGVNMEYSPNQEDHHDHEHDHDQHHNRQVRPVFPIPSSTATTSSSNFLAEFSHKGKSSSNSLSFDLDP